MSHSSRARSGQGGHDLVRSLASQALGHVDTLVEPPETSLPKPRSSRLLLTESLAFWWMSTSSSSCSTPPDRSKGRFCGRSSCSSSLVSLFAPILYQAHATSERHDPDTLQWSASWPISSSPIDKSTASTAPSPTVRRPEPDRSRDT